MLRLIGFYNYTVVLTYLSLFCGLVGMKYVHSGRFGMAILCLMLSGICDLFDGAVARTKKDRTREEKSFGIQLDSLCDVICFGVFPAVFLYCSGVTSLLGFAILVLYVLCALIRLAFFNMLEGQRQMTEGGCAKSYRGLPVTTAAVIYPLVYLIGLALPREVMQVVYHIVPFAMAILFVWDFSIPKFDIGKLIFPEKNDK
jgi:CDP-diacylglycerol--serine O-phosphatidyltransferase